MVKSAEDIRTFINVKIDISSPLIILPFSANNDINSECWVYNIGDIRIKTNEDFLSNSEPIEEKPYEIYDIDVSSIRFQYYPSIKYFESFTSSKMVGGMVSILSQSMNITKKNTSSQVFSIIDDLSFSFKAKILKNKKLEKCEQV